MSKIVSLSVEVFLVGGKANSVTFPFIIFKYQILMFKIIETKK